MPALRLLESRSVTGTCAGDLLCCTYTPDGIFVVTGGWDGYVRLWEAGTGMEVTSVHTGAKPVTACAVTADSKHWLTGSSEGLLADWDALSHRQLSIFLAHPRPISAIVFSADGGSLVTASWDKSAIVWKSLCERVGRPLKGHHDIVAGCRFAAGDSQLLTWSHDNTLRLWDLASGALADDADRPHGSGDSGRSVCRRPAGHFRRTRRRASPLGFAQSTRHAQQQGDRGSSQMLLSLRQPIHPRRGWYRPLDVALLALS